MHRKRTALTVVVRLSGTALGFAEWLGLIEVELRNSAGPILVEIGVNGSVARDRQRSPASGPVAIRERMDAAVSKAMGVRLLNIDLITDAITQMRKYVDPEFPVDQIVRLTAVAWHESEIVFENEEDLGQQLLSQADLTRSRQVGSDPSLGTK